MLLIRYSCHEESFIFYEKNKLYKLFSYKLIYKCKSIGIGPSSNCSIGIDQFLGIRVTLILSSYVILANGIIFRNRQESAFINEELGDADALKQYV